METREINRRVIKEYRLYRALGVPQLLALKAAINSVVFHSKMETK
ncbi:hypothetical protein [Hydrogenimonas sp.]